VGGGVIDKRDKVYSYTGAFVEVHIVGLGGLSGI